MYTEVSEKVYKNIVRDRLQRDDFVEEDGVDGYADDGMDHFGEPMQESEDEEDIKSLFKLVFFGWFANSHTRTEESEF